MIAGRYTLLEQPAAAQVLPACEKHSTSVVLASVFNSGLLARDELAADARYEYGPVPQEVRTRYKELARICHGHGVRVPAAALQFGLRHAAVRSVVVGAATAGQVTQSAAAMAEPIPVALWDDLADRGLLG